MRQREDNVRIRHRQQFCGLLGEPVVPRPAAALRTMPVEAGVGHQRFALAVVALIQMGAERGGATRAEVAERLQLAVGQSRPPVLEKLLLVLTKDIGDGGPMRAHRCRALSSDRSIG
jgi:hypothetical protein